MFMMSMLWAGALVCAQEPASVPIVQLPHAWTVGTKYQIELTTSREDSEPEKPVKRASITMPIDVEVLAKRSEGYTYRWVFGKPTTDDPSIDANALASKMMSLVNGMTMDLSADAAGSVVGLADEAAMQKFLEHAVQEISTEMEASKIATKEEIDTARSMVKALKGTAARSPYYRYPQMFYMPSGAELELGTKRFYDDELPNPFGGQAIPSKAYLQLREIKAADNEAVVEWRQTIDPERAAPILEKSIRAFMKRTGKELPTEAPLSFDAIEDAATFVYDMTTGIPKSVLSSRTTMVAGRKRIDTQQFLVRPVAKK